MSHNIGRPHLLLELLPCAVSTKASKPFSKAWPLLLLLLVAVGCGGERNNGEPIVPTVNRPADGAIVRVPQRADGTLDTAGMPIMRFSTEDQLADQRLGLDFGTVDEGAIINHRFGFRNAGQEPLLISAATSTCGCTVPIFPKQPIPPQDTGSIFVRFDTRDKAGPQDKVVTVTANTFPNTIQLHLVGTVDTLR